MKCFTPDRLVRLQDRSDEQRFRSALDEWEQSVAAYQRQLSQIQDLLPSGLRHLIDKVALHDARVINISQGQRSRLTIILQPEADPSRLVVLDYSLIDPVEINTDALPATARSLPLQWLYDELDVAPTGDAGSQATETATPTYWHSILLSNGWEVKVRFRGVTVRRPVSLLTANSERHVVTV